MDLWQTATAIVVIVIGVTFIVMVPFQMTINSIKIWWKK